MNLFKSIIILLYCTALGQVVFAQNKGKLTVEISAIKEAGKGQLIFLVFNNSEGFPMESEKAFQKGVVKDFGSQASYTFDQLPYGTYAISIFHDQNEDGEVATNLIGIPKEPVGASNMTKMGRPNFDKCQIEFHTTEKVLELVFIND